MRSCQSTTRRVRSSTRAHRPARRLRGAWAAMLVAGALVTCGEVRAAPQPSVLKQVEGAIMCICPDDCGKVLINCTCTESEKYRARIRAMIDQGLTADQIVDRFVAEKGKIVLAAPTTKGFDLTAWVLPFLALGVSIPIVVVVIRKLGSRTATSTTDRGSDSAEPGAPVDSSLAAKLDRELEKLDH